MTPAPTFSELLDRLDDGESTVGLLSRAEPGLGRMLLIEIRCRWDLVGLYPAPLADAERAARLLRCCPLPDPGEASHSAGFARAALGEGLELQIGESAVRLTHPAFGEVL